MSISSLWVCCVVFIIRPTNLFSHQSRYAQSGQIFVLFRSTAPGSKISLKRVGQFAWRKYSALTCCLIASVTVSGEPTV